jgi:transposase
MRKGYDGLAMLVQEVPKKSPHSGHMFVFRGKLAVIAVLTFVHSISA